MKRMCNCSICGAVRVSYVMSFPSSKRSVSPLTCHVTLAAYAVVILIGISGNLLVLAAVSGRKKMHTAHNFFIAALACSDLFLCSW